MQGLGIGLVDHVELFVPDRYEAADWYEKALGMKIVHDLEDWAVGGGPLMISGDGGGTMLGPSSRERHEGRGRRPATTGWLSGSTDRPSCGSWKD